MTGSPKVQIFYKINELRTKTSQIEYKKWPYYILRGRDMKNKLVYGNSF